MYDLFYSGFDSNCTSRGLKTSFADSV